MDLPDIGLSDALDVVDGVRIVRRIRKDGLVRTLAPIAARRGAEAAILAGGGAPASSVAYAGVGGTMLHAGVALGVCSTPLIVSAVPVVAFVGSLLAARAVSRALR